MERAATRCWKRRRTRRAFGSPCRPRLWTSSAGTPIGCPRAPCRRAISCSPPTSAGFGVRPCSTNRQGRVLTPVAPKEGDAEGDAPDLPRPRPTGGGRRSRPARHLRSPHRGDDGAMQLRCAGGGGGGAREGGLAGRLPRAPRQRLHEGRRWWELAEWWESGGKRGRCYGWVRSERAATDRVCLAFLSGISGSNRRHSAWENEKARFGP